MRNISVIVANAAKKQNYKGSIEYPIILPFDTVIFQRPHRMKKRNGHIIIDPLWYIKKYHPIYVNEFLELCKRKRQLVPTENP